jgi:repressor LexA
MLTIRQQQLLDFLKGYHTKYGRAPNFVEMMTALNLKSKSGVHRLLNSLEERGHINRLQGRSRAIQVKDVSHHHIKNIPMLGRIAAGHPIEAIEVCDTMLSVPAHLLKTTDEHYALTVVGDSMEGLGILDGDIAIIRACREARNGAIVVALVNNDEVTLKTFFKSQGVIRLEPANKNYQTRILPLGSVAIQGILAMVYRNYE